MKVRWRGWNADQDWWCMAACSGAPGVEAPSRSRSLWFWKEERMGGLICTQAQFEEEAVSWHKNKWLVLSRRTHWINGGTSVTMPVTQGKCSLAPLCVCVYPLPQNSDSPSVLMSHFYGHLMLIHHSPSAWRNPLPLYVHLTSWKFSCFSSTCLVYIQFIFQDLCFVFWNTEKPSGFWNHSALFIVAVAPMVMPSRVHALHL